MIEVLDGKKCVLRLIEVPPFDFDDPAAGPPDLSVRVNNLDQFHFSFPVSADYVIRVNKRS